MRRILTIITLLFVFQSNAQQKYALGFSFGLGKNYFHNDYTTDANHFNFESPTSITIGTQLVKYINPKNQLVFKLGYTSKKIKFVYETNEPDIPYNVNETTIDKYNCLSLSAGYRRPFHISTLKMFAEIDLVADYNVNGSQSTEGNGNGTGDSNTPLDEPILYQFNGTDNIGQKSITMGSTVALGFNFGKKEHSELSFNINVPFNNIQNKTSAYQYNWQYQGKEYAHKLDYKGSIVYPSVVFTYYAFNK
ncbi:MAG: hypothetical protein V4581_01005 [Bacteroidota bacterium]